MKKTLFISVLFFAIIVVSGCSNTKNSSDKNSSSDTNSGEIEASGAISSDAVDITQVQTGNTGEISSGEDSGDDLISGGDEDLINQIMNEVESGVEDDLQNNNPKK